MKLIEYLLLLKAAKMKKRKNTQEKLGNTCAKRMFKNRKRKLN